MLRTDRPAPASHRRTRSQASPAATRLCVETFESRILFHLHVETPVPDQVVNVNSSPTTINLATNIFNEEAGPTVRVATTSGNIDIMMFEKAAPLTVQNFLNYTTSGRFNNTVIHRSAFLTGHVPFVVQGGGYVPSGTHITQFAAVQNEFRPNTNNRGTVAMAKPGNNPNGATSEWFVNLRDNNDILDGQNGGFTSFGQVINNGMAVADAISALPVINAAATSNGGAWTDLPVTVNPPSSNPPPANQMVLINNVAVIAPTPVVTFAATSSNTNLVNTAVQSNTLVLSYIPGQTGTATITVTGTEAGSGTTTQDVFTVTVGSVDSNIGQGSNAQTIQYTDADGTVGTIRVAGGAATVSFSGSGITQTVTGRTTVVSGTGVEVAKILLTGNAPNVTVQSKGGDDRLIVSGISAAGPARGFSGRGVTLRGISTLSNGIGKLDVARAENATITIQQSGQAGLKPASISIGTAENTKIDSQQSLGSVRLGGWTGTDAAQDTITAPAINSLQANGDFVGGLTVSGNGQAANRPALGSVRISGGVASGTWNVGKASNVAIGSVGSGWTGTFADLASFSTTGDLSGTLTATSINALSAASITGANIVLNRAAGPKAVGLGRLTSRGPITSSVIRSTADIGTVTAAAISNSSIYAGVAVTDGGVLPGSATEFSSPSTIRGVTVRNRGSSVAFLNSDIAASTLGRMNLGVVQVDNAGVPFGLAANSISSLTATGANGAPVRASRLEDPADGLNLSAFEVRVF